jgi:ABC-type amino acid transport substrate-binding protein
MAPVAGKAAEQAPPPSSVARAEPAALVVGLRLQDPALQAGVLRGGQVILARGLEVQLARLVARRLGEPISRFVAVRDSAGRPAAGSTRWGVLLNGIGRSGSAGARVDLSAPYLRTGAVVVLRRGLSKPRGLADLRDRVLCAVRGGGAARVISTSVRPSRKPLLATDDDRLRALVRTGACDAALVPAVEAGRFVRGQAGRLGPAGGWVPDGHGLAIAVSRSAGPDVAAVDRELRRLRADGTLGRLARSWLGLDPARLRTLR